MTVLKRLPFAILLLSLCTTLPAAPNQLKNHPSPYLAMHGDDPTQWQEWNPQTVARARKENKLILVSSGYFSCHWCHVMQKESYQNPDIARLLNKHFIPVKVDRELDSALDAHLIDFVQRTQGISGWPLNVFVTPEGYPLVGMVYVPPDNFKQILEKLHQEWTARGAELKKVAEGASQELSTAETTSSTVLPPDLAMGMQQSFISHAFSHADTLQGGFGQDNKFPSVPQLMTLLDIQQRIPNDQVKQFLELTLNQMASQGLRDQLGGGFYRYVVDPGWQIPHFEKMLYDNALLASLYFKAAEVLNEKSYTDVATETLDFILSELATRTPAFAASLSAVDDKGIEGGFYLWDDKDLQSLLTKQEWKVASRFWAIQGPPDLEDGHHLVQVMSLDELAKELKQPRKKVEALLKSASEKMHAQRSKRVLPKDDKILTAWNGLALTAFVEGARITGDKEYHQAAKALRDFIESQLWDRQAKQLHKAIGKSGSLGPGGLEDYAFVAEGLYVYWKLTNDTQTRDLLSKILQQAWQRFYGKQGWILAQDMLLKYGSGKTVVSDGPMPSPSSLLVLVSYRFGKDAAESNFVNQVLRAMNVGHNEMRGDAYWFATQIRAISVAQTKD